MTSSSAHLQTLVSVCFHYIIYFFLVSNAVDKSRVHRFMPNIFLYVFSIPIYFGFFFANNNEIDHEQPETRQ